MNDFGKKKQDQSSLGPKIGDQNNPKLSTKSARQRNMAPRQDRPASASNQAAASAHFPQRPATEFVRTTSFQSFARVSSVSSNLQRAKSGSGFSTEAAAAGENPWGKNA